jgi:hypothetical protein
LEVELTKASEYGGLVLKKLPELKGIVINMKEHLDPKVISENAVDLNLKLMKWRMLPSLNLEVL